MLVDDRSSAVSLPELPLLGVLPGTGGLTRVVDKRHVRRDLADFFSTKAEGIGGSQGASSGAWSTRSCRAPKWDEAVASRAAELGDAVHPPRPAPASRCPPLRRRAPTDQVSYRYVDAELDRVSGTVEITRRRAGHRRAGRPRRPARPRRRVLVARGDPRARRR